MLMDRNEVIVQWFFQSCNRQGEYHQIETGKWWIKQDINDSMKVLWILSYKSTIEAPVILPYNTK